MTDKAPWNRFSGVASCPECEGTGFGSNGLSEPNPFPARSCTEGSADGYHGPECPVCGFRQIVRGYDCLACDTVAALDDEACAALSEAWLYAALGNALAARRAAAA